jgi:hypothetical protein
MRRTFHAVVTLTLAVAACALALACGQTCKCEGDVCTDCSGTTPTAPAPDGGTPDASNLAVVDATVDGLSGDASDSGVADAIDSTVGPTPACAGGCACNNTADACAASGCTLGSAHEPDGATVFDCRNLPLGLVCGGRGGRCLAAGVTCANPASYNDCDLWPSTGALCCLDQFDAGTDAGSGQEAGVGADAGAGCISGCSRRSIACVAPDPPTAWSCLGPGISGPAPFLEAGCTSLPINSLVWCCPNTFLSQCP